MNELTITTLKSSFVSPLRSIQPNEIPMYSNAVRLIGGIYDNLDRPHLDSLRKTASNRVQAHDSFYTINRNIAQHIKNKAVYGGIIFNHYGHFLLESLSRAWYIRNSYDDIYFYNPSQCDKETITYDDLLSWQQEILKHLVVDTNRIEIITQPLVFNQLIIPQVGYILRQYCADSQAHALLLLGQAITANSTAIKPIDKVWLSRSLLDKGRIAGEKKFETALANEGFVIVHPQIIPLTEQITLFQNTSVIAGFAGSAFHTVLLAKNNGAKLLHFYRKKNPNENYPVCAKAAGFSAEFYNFFLRHGSVSGQGRVNVLQDLTGIWQVLYEQGLVKTEYYFDHLMEQDLIYLDKELSKLPLTKDHSFLLP